MKLINITCSFNDILIIDNQGIKAYNKNYDRRDKLSKMSFNVEMINNDIIISHGDDYQYYEFYNCYQINQLTLHGHGIYHIKMTLNDDCIINQNDCTCHLYHLKPTLNLFVHLNNAKLIGCYIIKKLNIKCYHSVIKNFDISDEIYASCKNYSFMCLTSTSHVTKKYFVDNTSTIIINGLKLYNSNIDIWSNL